MACPEDETLKVISIFGNTGDGKSYTLNHTFFDGKEVFSTSASQVSCTVGIWAAYDENNHLLIVDSEGLLSTSNNSNQQKRLLMKILAISDVIIYRTKAERLHLDMFSFLGDASEAYLKHFSPELKAALQRGQLNMSLCSLGPAVVIFHETQHTDVLGTQSSDMGNNQHFVKFVAGRETDKQTDRQSRSPSTREKDQQTVGRPFSLFVKTQSNLLQYLKLVHHHMVMSSHSFPIGDKEGSKSADEILKKRFADVGHHPQAFSCIKYVGTKSVHNSTSFRELLQTVIELTNDTSVRSQREIGVVYDVLNVSVRVQIKTTPNLPQSLYTTLANNFFA